MPDGSLTIFNMNIPPFVVGLVVASLVIVTGPVLGWCLITITNRLKKQSKETP
jgi:hypothetical protein